MTCLSTATGDLRDAQQIDKSKFAGLCALQKRWDRPELHRLLDQLLKGDVLTIMARLGESEAGFRSLTEAIDTTTPGGRMMMQMVGAFADHAEFAIMQRHSAGVAVWPAYQ